MSAYRTALDAGGTTVQADVPGGTGGAPTGRRNALRNGGTATRTHVSSR
ncbi:hypothetical protein [Streptomyces scopuliridis]|uniref:Uncharacterized protein n=1 Tax=Streptomyces scopuliridis RB72 TaxID=1440053 RepID=A0A2T7TB12_9ACTN|nr:hypothetical protein [Streptomyces scopuliridis]PVE12360.1 hypothetical protein Y717_03390 [Streptomyces scopuliridis RB72]